MAGEGENCFPQFFPHCLSGQRELPAALARGERGDKATTGAAAARATTLAQPDVRESEPHLMWDPTKNDRFRSKEELPLLALADLQYC